MGVVFGGTEKELLFLPFSDVECSHKRYHSLQEILEIAEDFNRQYNNKHIRCSVPTLAEWNAIIRNLGKTDVFGKSAPDMCDRTGVGRIEAYPMFDDGEEDDNVLRLIGMFLC